MEYVSNSQFSDTEFHKWKVEVRNEVVIGSPTACLCVYIDGEERVNVAHSGLCPSQGKETGGNEEYLIEGGGCGKGW